MTWEEYCAKKKIDSKLFQKAEPERWKEFKELFEQMHPNSFTEQKKFLINDLRRRYLLVEEVKEEAKPVEKKPGIKLPFKK